MSLLLLLLFVVFLVPAAAAAVAVLAALVIAAAAAAAVVLCTEIFSARARTRQPSRIRVLATRPAETPRTSNREMHDARVA